MTMTRGRVGEITGGYQQQLVMGLTPWNSVRLVAPETRTDWPPYRDAARLQTYTDYTALIENRPADVFENLNLSPDQVTKILIAAALPELLCNVWADSIWTDPPTIELRSTKAQDEWDAIDKANDYSEIGAWESVFGAAFSGTSVLRLFRSEDLGALTGNVVQIEEIDPSIFFPILRRGSARIIEAVVLAWEEDRAGPDEPRSDWWQVREIHQVVNGRYTIEKQERKPPGIGASATFLRVGPVVITDLDFLPFVDMHAKRWRGRYWGVSELARNVSIFDEVDNTLSNIAEILEYHGKPMLQVPASVVYGGILAKGADRAMGIRNPQDANTARYITYDGQLSAQLSSLDKLLELAFLTSEVPRTYFGLGLEGGVPSGTSLKLQLQNYLKKAGRWQGKETMRSRALVDMALRMAGGFDDPAARDATVTHGSPLPVDDEQQVRIVTAAVTGGLMSTKSGVGVMKRLGFVQDVDEELAEIESEKEASIAALPPPLASNALGVGADGNPQPNPGQPGQPDAGATR